MVNEILGIVVLYALFFGMCFLGTGGDEKNMNSYYSYPDAVQEKIKADEKLRRMIPKEKSKSATAAGNLLLFTFVFVILGAIVNVRQAIPSLCYFLIAGEGLNLFDLLIIDACWWRSAKRTKFSTIQDASLYRDMHKHIGSFVRGIPTFAACAFLASAILSVIPQL